MRFIETPLQGLYVISPDIKEDERGLFLRTYCKNEFAEIGFTKEFVQFNHSFNLKKGTVRGMHFQVEPYSETKLIRCVKGSVYDVAVDIRKDSSTYLEYFGIEINEKNMLSIFIPEGFAHGFQTLEDNSALIYHHTDFFTPNADSGLPYNESSINISWPLPVTTISDKDKTYRSI